MVEPGMSDVINVLWAARLSGRSHPAICLSSMGDAHDKNSILVSEQLVDDSIIACAQAAKAAQIASEWIAGQRIVSEVVYLGSDLPPSSGRQALQVFPRAAFNPNRIVHSSPGPSPELDPRGRPNAQRLF